MTVTPPTPPISIDHQAADQKTLELAYTEARETQDRLERWADALDGKIVSLFTIGSAALGAAAVFVERPFSAGTLVLGWLGFALWGIATYSALRGFNPKEFVFGPDIRAIVKPEWLNEPPARYQALRLEDLAAAYAENRETLTEKAESLRLAVICTTLEIAALVVAALLS